MLAGKGVLAIWNGIALEAESDFVAWHVREHIPERVAVPGFRRGRRYVAVSGTPKYFNFYETDDATTLLAPAYLDRLNHPSDWTKRVVRHFTDTSRTVCSVAASVGQGDGAFICAIRMTSRMPPATLIHTLVLTAAEPLLTIAGIAGVHLLEGQLEAANLETAEKALRAEPDQTAAWILLIGATDPEPLEEALGDIASPEALAAIGADYGQNDHGIYRLQFALSRDQLAGPLPS